MSNRQILDWFAKALCDQNNGTMGAEPRIRRTLTRHNNHLLINSWFLSESLIKFNDIVHKYKTALSWFDDIIFVPLIRTEILHFSGISSGAELWVHRYTYCMLEPYITHIFHDIYGERVTYIAYVSLQWGFRSKCSKWSETYAIKTCLSAVTYIFYPAIRNPQY